MKPKKSTLAIFLLPAIVLFLLIYLLPLLLVVCTSFFNWKIGSPIFFSGLENYLKAVQDKNVHAAVGHTLIWVLLQSTVHVFLGTLLAFILAKQFRGWKVFRTVCMLPNVISTAALAMILLNVFKTDSGLLNGIISLITGNKFEWNWYFNSKTAIPSVTLGWLLYPGLITILMLAAINSIPMDLLDAAKIDGASASQINLMIILPMVRNSLGSLAQNAKEYNITHIVFMDNNVQKLNIFGALAREVAIRIMPSLDFTLTTNPVEAIQSADYIITTIRAGEDDMRIRDERIALAHNVLGQETTGAAGFSFAMRSVPALAEYCELVRKYANPNAKVFNFTNPAGVVSQTLRDMGYDFTFGICDAPTGMLRSFAHLYGIAPETVTATCYGLNHLSFFNSIQFSGKEMLPTLINDDRIYATTDMRFFSKELTKKMGCILNEYLYYFFYREKAVQNILDAHVTRGEVIRDVNKHMIEELSHLDPVKDFDKCLEVYVKWQGQRSAMYMKNETGIRRPDPFTFDLTSHDDGGYAGVALKYIKAQQTGKPVEMIFCVPNNGAIPGLLDSDVVEISCTIQPDGTYLPHAIQNPGEIPMEIIRRVKLYERYASRAIRNRSRDDAITCLMVHPLVNSYSLAETLVDEYLKLNQEYIKEWS